MAGKLTNLKEKSQRNILMYKSTVGQLLILFALIFPIGSVTAGVKTRIVEVSTTWGVFSAEIHYREWERGFADRVEQVLRNDSAALFDYFRYVPRGSVQFTTEQESSISNGMATIFYGNRIVLNNHPPISPGHLSYTGDWIKLLVLHELTHIIHMDQTNGFPGGVRNIFGFYGKWGGVAPRWFLEGVAVWAESNFSEAGRLRNKKMRYEYDATLFSDDICSSIDCLDDPGVYPFKQYPYWAGAYFIEYLEKTFPGTVRCLVKENSYYFPGFLGQVFYNCLKLPAGGLYQLFKQSRLQKIASMTKTPRSLTELKYEKEGGVVWQKGYSIIGNKLFVTERDLNREHFVELDLDNGNKSSYDFSYLIEHIPALSSYSKQNHTIPLTLFTISGDDFIRHGELWKVQAQDSVDEIDFYDKKAAHYLFEMGKDDSLVVSNHQGTWEIKRNKKLIASLAPLETLSAPRIVTYDRNEKLVIRSFKKGAGYRLLLHSLKIKDSWSVIYSSDTPFEVFDQLGTGLLIQTDKGHLEKVIVEGSKVTVYRYSPAWGSHLVDVRTSANKVIVLLEGMPGKILTGKPTQFEDEINSKWASTRTYKVKADSTVTKKVVKKDEQSYPSLRHFVPKGWLFDYTSGDSGYFGATTGFHDPRRHHFFDLAGRYYNSFEKYAPTIGYQYNWRGRDRFLISGSYDEDYSWNSYVGRIRKESVREAKIAWRLPLGRWENSVSVSVSREDFDNSNSVIALKKYSVQDGITYKSLFDNAFFYDFAFVGLGHQYETDGFSKFYGVELKAKVGFQLHRRLGLSLSSNWGRLYKDTNTLASGFLEGGDKEGAFYHVYGVEYSDIFGLRVATARCQLDWNWLEIYGGSGMLPVFLRKIHLFAGLDRFKSDYFVSNGTLFLDSTFNTAHVGIRFEAVIGFYLPATLEVSYARLLDFHDEGKTTVLFNLGI